MDAVELARRVAAFGAGAGLSGGGMIDDDILARLFALNQARAAGR